ncbi:hypothetical protein [Maribacter sp. HTCC2170]|uniref:hypothetical protein n=1 Tax=Maribacter sp. (strain HTCC2170 / KCCM 42371) TaxID=313603 RepID=UPI00006B2176|nr:hypothetical protein [Maribacter sp. HTCC2170]EAR00128.1 hypothetical protein FB2170_00640 [Maribacter sp. HTCC2170]
MKPTITVFLLFLGLSLLQAQKNSGKICFKDGRCLSGLIQIKGNKVLFRTSKSDPKKVFNFEKVHSFNYSNRKRASFSFEYVPIKKQGKPQILQVIVSGTVKLYKQNNASFSMNDGIGNYKDTSTYYLKKGNEQTATLYVAFGYIPKTNFKKVSFLYFKDCLDLVNRIDRNEFKKEDYKEIIEFYNTNCGEISL